MPEITVGGSVTHAAPAAQRRAGGQRPRRQQSGTGGQCVSTGAHILLRLQAGLKLHLRFVL